MKLILEELEYQKQAIASIVKVFDGQEKNTFENSFFFEIKSNVSSLTPEGIAANKQRVIEGNGLATAVCNLTDDNDYCVEMETGTGKTLVYIAPRLYHPKYTVKLIWKKYGKRITRLLAAVFLSILADALVPRSRYLA